MKTQTIFLPAELQRRLGEVELRPAQLSSNFSKFYFVSRVKKIYGLLINPKNQLMILLGRRSPKGAASETFVSPERDYIIMKTYNSFLIGLILCLFSCNQHQEKTNPLSFAPKVVEAHGYVVPKDSMAEPKVIPAGKPRVVKAGKPKVVLTNTNVHPAGIPKVVTAGVPKVCTPGQDGYSLPKIVPAIDSPFLAGIPEVVIAKEAYTKDQNPQNFSSFGKLQGLKHSTITCLLEDKSGNLWFGTPGGGVSKYDGKNFTHFTEKEGLSNNNVLSILEDKSGNLWFGTGGGGVSKYDSKSFTHFTDKEGLSNNNVRSLLEDKNGNLWFGTAGGVCKYDLSGDKSGVKSFTHFTEKEGLSNNNVRNLLEDKSGNLWFGTQGGGVSKYDGKSFTHFTEKEGLSNNDVRSILEDKSGNLWFGTEGGGVNKYAASGDAGKSFTQFTEKEGLSDNDVRTILEDKSGNLWFGTNGGGVNKYNASDNAGKSFTHFTDKEGLSNNNVSSLLEDKSGNLWFGTINGGVSKYGSKSFTHFTVKEGLNNNDVRTILEDKIGNLWFGTNGGGVSKYDAKSFTHFTEKEGLSNNVLISMLQDKSGNLWFGTFGGGVNKYDGKSFTHFTDKEGLGNNNVMSILEDKSGNLWFGTNGRGVSKYDGKTFTHFTDKEGLGNNNVRIILEDKSGNLWFGTHGRGVSKYNASSDAGKRFTRYTVGVSVMGMLEDKSGNLWFGTFGGGVIKYDPAEGRKSLPDGLSADLSDHNGMKAEARAKEGATAAIAKAGFTYFTEKEGLSNNFVSNILEDKIGDLWFGTRFGLNKLKKDELSKTTFSLSEPGLFFKTYTYEDGFSGIGVNFGKAMLEAKDGTIWIGTDDRLTAFHPGEETPDTIAPNIQLTGLALFNENIAWQNLVSPSIGGGRSPDSYREGEVKDTSILLGNGVNVHDFQFDEVSKWYGVPEDLSLVYNNNYLTFQFVGITLQAPKKVKYQYKLEGLDKNWSALTNRSEATYGNLGHGTYTFKVKAMNGGGYWSKELAYSFVIRPPWWLTWWAYTIYGLLVVVAAWSIHRYQKQRIVRIEQEKAQKKELELGKEIEKAYTNLKATQAQLIQSEKMASLGELTAGIAHEIQNPLNFVNNFSEINTELLDELRNEINEKSENGIQLLNVIKENESKINQHGKRADAIVKSMLQHSHINSGQKEMTDINALADEYLRLAYHAFRAGLRAKDKDFNASMKTDFDETIDKVNIISQDIGRVLLNLINNAFYAVAERSNQMKFSANEKYLNQGTAAVSERKKQNVEGYEPTVSVSTKKIDNKVLISVKDNGNGIPQKVLDKIFQPFFTTKPTGQGTGLGLSLSYDIVKAHGGTITVNSFNGPPGGSISVFSNYCEPGTITVNTYNGPPGGVPIAPDSYRDGMKMETATAKEGEGSEFIISLPL